MEIDALWRPTKYVKFKGRLRASRDPGEVGVGSRLVADATARFYEAAIAQHARGRLLDLGCGKAPLYGFYGPLADEVLRVDWSDGLHGQNNVDFIHDLNMPLPFDADRFDTIIFSDVLEHLLDPARCWSDLARVLASKGKIILNVPFYYQLHEEPYDFFRYTEHSLRHFAEQNGLIVESLEPLGGAPEVVVDVISKVLCGKRLGRPIAAGLQNLHGLLFSMGPGRGLSVRTARTFPLSYAMIVKKP